MGDLKYIKDPRLIEKKSFEIIESCIDRANFDDKELAIVKRVIHATADFEYARILKFSKEAVDEGLNALRKGCRIITDTRMTEAGINKRALKAAGCEVGCYIDHPDAARISRELGITRAMASIIMAAGNKDNRIFAIGNAPTALFKLVELVKKGTLSPALVIGVPVGFVGAGESKDALSNLDVPHIITGGRKGGSTVAAAVVNALLYMLGE